MKNLKDISLRNKLVLLVVLPLSVLLYFLQKTIITEFDRKESTIRNSQNMIVIESISRVIHQLQKEGNAAQISAINRQRERVDIMDQQEQTDMAIADLQKVSTKYEIQVQGIDTLSTLSTYRKRLDSFPQIAHQVNLNLLDQISIIMKIEKNHEIKSQAESVLFLLYAKEFLAQLRVVNLSVLPKDSTQRGYGDFPGLKGKYEMNLYAFKKNSPPYLLDYFDTNFETAAAVVRMNSALENFSPYGGASFPIDRETWLTDVSSAFNILTNIEGFAFESIKERITTESENIQKQLTKKIALASLVVIVLLFFAVILINTIINSVKEMRDATERIIKGDIDFELNVTSKDELGQLAVSFNKVISVFKDYIEIANSIGRGNYDFNIKLRSDKDFLGKALGSMRDNLNNLYKEKETTTWLLTGNNSLNDKFREEKEVRNLARDVITQIAFYLKAQVGAIYLVERGRINRVGSYALDPNTPESFEIGQSLVGQAVQDRKSILFEKVPQDYVKITSGLGSSLPTNIIVFPFFYVGKVKGVIELGASKEFTALDQEYLQLVGDNIAIAFNSSQSRSKLKELLEETQRQAEELESQQEELKQFNDELLDKIKSIETSEAALKVQQEELQQSNAELEETASMLESDKQVLEKAKIAVEEKARGLESLSKYKSQFLANMSHELRTPLNSILILTQLLIENKNGSLNEKEIKYTNVIYNAGNELLTLINDILDLSKVESGNMELMEEEVSIQEIVSDMSMMFSEVAKNKSIAFKIDVSTIKERRVYTDKQRLEQILRNFLSNAFKFTPADGIVTLSVYKASDPKFELKGTNGDPTIVAFSVSDTGIGIQQDKQELIFEAFRQVDSTDKRKYGGTGLGLSISRELADLLGGEIDLASEEGKGSTFTFYLPLRSPHRHDSTFKASPVNGSELKKTEHLKRHEEEKDEEVFFDDRDTLKKNSRTILIMEDDKDFAQVILAFVRERNYKGIIAHQGNIGLSYARLYKPDAILLDMKLPVIDGEEVIRQLKNDAELRHIPIQIISGYSLRKEAMKLGAFDFIKKPVKKEDLEKVFKKLEDFANRRYKRLLIIENNAEENKAMCDLIGNGDVECVPAFSTNEAYKKLNEVSFDCIVVDIGVPDPSGFEFLEKIKSDSLINHIPIIVYSVQDLTKEQNQKLGVLANTVVLKTALSHERLLDETTLFLHRVEANMPKEKQNIIRKLHQADTVLKDKKILIVDDDIRNIYSLTSALEEEGMHCLTAENGREAIKLLNKNPDVNIILMDVMMPEMNGYEATVEIRKAGNFAKVPIIAITAKAMKGDREKCLAAGMSDYISKPVDINQLLSLMRVWLYN